MIKKSILATFLTFLSFVISAGASGKDTIKELSKKYRDAALVEMAVEKKVTSDLLGKETKSSGKMFLSKTKFKWTTSTPEKNLIVFDGTYFWTEQSPHKDFGGPIQVVKAKIDKKNSSNALISSLFGGDLQKNFKVLSQKDEGEKLVLSLSPSGQDLTIQNLIVTIDKKKLEMRLVEYSDDIGNKTQLEFSDVKFNSKSKSKLFKYTPPKGAQVTEL